MTAPPSLSEDGSDLVGRTLCGYQLLRRLGHGGMAFVYLAQQESLRRLVAVKVLKPGLASDTGYVRRFHREAQAAAALIHPNIVQIFEIGQEHGLHFIAQEYVAGRNLKQWMQRQPSLPVSSTLAILRQVASALGKAADARIVHRDIKPENILVAEDGMVKVADFGLARIESDHGSMELTRAGMTMGTPRYMSPEQIQGQPLDSRSDIYSLGVTAYQLLSGRAPFEANNAISLAMQQLQEEPTALDQLRPDVPPELARLVKRMMSKLPEQRPATPLELLAELESIPDVTEKVPRRRWEHWSGRVAATTGRLEATKRLAAALRQQGPHQPSRQLLQPSWRWALVLVPIILGAMAALLSVPSDPLTRFHGQVDSPHARRESLQKQFLQATLADTETAWQQVVSYYPDDEKLAPQESYYVRTARQRLARLYLQQRRYREAMGHLAVLTQLPETERGLRAFGFAGLAVAHASLQDWDRAADAFTRYLPLRSALENEPADSFLQQSLRRVEQQIRQRLAADARDD